MIKLLKESFINAMYFCLAGIVLKLLSIPVALLMGKPILNGFLREITNVETFEVVLLTFIVCYLIW